MCPILPLSFCLLTSHLESSSGSDFRPTRRVRTAPGGETHDIFGHHVDDDALAAAPPRDVPVAAAATAEPTHARYGVLPPTILCNQLTVVVKDGIEHVLGREQQ